MHILIIVKFIPDPLNHNKSDLFFSTLQSHIEAGHRVTLLTSGDEAPTEYESLPIRLKPAQRLILRLLWRMSLRAYELFLARVVAKTVGRSTVANQIDCILAECLDRIPALHGSAISRRLKVPFVVREHQTHYHRFYQSADEIPEHNLAALRGADALAAVTPNLAARLTDLGVRDDVTVVPNSVSSQSFQRPAGFPQDSEAWFREGFVFGGWTKWREIKRIDVLLHAFCEVSEKIPEAKLVVAGQIFPEAHRDWAQDLISANGLGDRVWLYGLANRDEIHQLAFAIDCCVIPSDYETFGLPAVEAMAAGRPSVVTACNGPESIIDRPELGRVVPRGDSNAFAKAMAEVVKQRGSFDEGFISEIAWRRYSEAVVGERFTELYQKCVRDSPSQQAVRR